MISYSSGCSSKTNPSTSFALLNLCETPPAGLGPGGSTSFYYSLSGSTSALVLSVQLWGSSTSCQGVPLYNFTVPMSVAGGAADGCSDEAGQSGQGAGRRRLGTGGVEYKLMAIPSYVVHLRGPA